MKYFLQWMFWSSHEKWRVHVTYSSVTTLKSKRVKIKQSSGKLSFTYSIAKTSTPEKHDSRTMTHSGYMGNVFTITQSVLFFYHYSWKSLFTVILVLESLEGWYPLSRVTLMIMLLRTSVPIKPLGLIISCQRFLRSKILAIEWNAKWSTSEVTL